MPQGASIVFGGSGGIGSRISVALARLGGHVVVTCHSNTKAAEAVADEIIANGGSASVAATDITQADAVAALCQDVAEARGAVDRVVYASGPSFEMNFISRIDPEEWSRVFDQDVKGCFNIVSAALPHLRQSGGNLTAVITCALDRVPVADILSAAPKAAIEMLIKGVAKEEGRYGVRANCVGPGWINAGLGARAVETKLSERDVARILKSIPLGGMGSGEDIAEAVAFLASDKARYITGQTLSVDGGLTL